MNHTSAMKSVKPFSSLTLILAVSLCALLSLVSTHAASAALANGTYKIVSQSGGLVLDVAGGVTTSGSFVDTWTYNSKSWQQWTVTYLGNGSYEIIGVGSSDALDVHGGSKSAGAQLDIWPYGSKGNQQWIITSASGGYYTVQGVQSGNYVQAGAKGVTAVMEPGNGAADQLWAFQGTATLGAASAANSTLSPPFSSLTANGTNTQVVTVQARDATDNNETSGGATVVFALSGAGKLSATTDNRDGTYSATLTASSTSGSATVTATLNGAAIGASVNASQSQATYFSANFGDAVPNLTPILKTNFTAGSTSFSEVYTPATGLGPIYNNSSCANCHNFPVTGGAGSSKVTRFGSMVSGSFNPLTSLDGTLLHDNFVNANCQETVPASANVTAKRITRPLWGDGLIEAIPDSAIVNNALIPNPDKIVGVVPYVTDPVDNKSHVGRFGWKGQFASLLTFVADASNNEIGLTNRVEPTGHAPNGNVSLYNQYNTRADPNDVVDASGKADIDRDSDYSRLLGPPPTTALTTSARAGQALFHQISCDACHTPTFTTSASFVPISDLSSETSTPIQALSNKTLPLYSDLLLHNMGTLSDGIAQAAASTTQMQTPPLWGLSHKLPYMHDGRAFTVDAAIRDHAGDAQPAATRYTQLTTAQQQQLQDFLNSL